jgi:uncharacterized damage-inducible protein DinB
MRLPSTDAGPASVGDEFLAEARYFLTVEYRTKIAHLLDALPPELLWQRPAEGSNAIGNLLRHLAGNVRQWIVAGLGGSTFARDRSAEFAADAVTDGADAATLLAHLDAALRDADAVLAGLAAQPPSVLLERRRIQSREITVLSAVFHVVEHFAMHTGQMILLAKAMAPGRVRFYADEPTGQAKPLWLDALRPVPGTNAGAPSDATAGAPPHAPDAGP